MIWTRQCVDYIYLLNALGSLFFLRERIMEHKTASMPCGFARMLYLNVNNNSLTSLFSNFQLENKSVCYKKARCKIEKLFEIKFVWILLWTFLWIFLEFNWLYLLLLWIWFKNSFHSNERIINYFKAVWFFCFRSQFCKLWNLKISRKSQDFNKLLHSSSFF